MRLTFRKLGKTLSLFVLPNKNATAKTRWHSALLIRPLTMILLAFGLHSAGALATDSTKQKHAITLFTHGDTVLFNKTPDGSIAGPSIDLFTCAIEKTGHTYSIEIAPLSRARTIIDEIDHAIWFPSAFQGNTDRLSRSIGPAGALEMFWHQLHSDHQDPESNAFKQAKKVTTYKGSAMEAVLRSQGYNVVEGSADRNRLIVMVLSGQVDALLSIDFRDRLSEEVRKKVDSNIHMTLRSSLPVAFQVTKPFAKSDPGFVTRFRTAFTHCIN